MVLRHIIVTAVKLPVGDWACAGSEPELFKFESLNLTAQDEQAFVLQDKKAGASLDTPVLPTAVAALPNAVATTAIASGGIEVAAMNDTPELEPSPSAALT